MGKYTSKITAALLLAGLLLPCWALAAGLGKLTVLSALGQPLKAEIELVAVDAAEADSLTARLASAEAFRQANIERTKDLTEIRFAVDRRPNGQFAVVLTSVQPISEPFLDMLVELASASGRLVREYTFLLDPPEYRAPLPAVPVAPVVVPAVPVAQPAPAPTAPTPARTESPAPVAARPLEAAPPRKPGATYEVKRGDTLAKIANQHKQEGVTLQQMLVALYRGNQDAFDGNNMNRLRAGKILNVPEGDSAASISADEARRLVSAQSRDFSEYRRQIGAAVAQAPERAQRGRQVAGRIGAPREEKPAPPAETTKDQLRLSKADEAKSPGRAGAAARADDLAAKEKALKEANERIAMLEKNVQDLQKLAQLKSEAGAQLQQAAKGAAKASPGPAPKAVPAPAAKAVEPVPPAAKSSEPAKAAEAGKAAPAAKAPEPAKAAEAPKGPEPAKAPEAAKAPPKAPAKAVPPPPPPEPSLMDELLDNPMALGAAGGVVVLLAGYAAYAWRRKRKSQFESSMMAASTPAESASELGVAGGQQVDTGSGTFQSDFSQGGIGKIDTEEIDPIAEADVYMAYGRDAQAEEILKEALGKDSSRHAIRAKLLEIYANRKDLKAFETTATELFAATGGQGPEWEKSVALGLSVDPQNPLYGGGSADAGAPAAGDTVVFTQAELAAAAAAPADAATEEAVPAPPLDFDLDVGGGAAAGAQPGGATGTAQPETSDALDFDLDLGGDAKAAEPAAGEAAAAVDAAEPGADTGLSIDFDLGPAAAPSAPAASNAPAAAPAADGGLSIDFDLGMSGEAKPADEKPAAPELDLSAISFDLGTEPAPAAGEGAAAPDAHWQEVATKLDLAKAYQEMGDKDGARELLNEVLSEGDGAQQQQAKAMLQALD